MEEAQNIEESPWIVVLDSTLEYYLQKEIYKRRRLQNFYTSMLNKLYSSLLKSTSESSSNRSSSSSTPCSTPTSTRRRSSSTRRGSSARTSSASPKSSTRPRYFPALIPGRRHPLPARLRRLRQADVQQEARPLRDHPLQALLPSILL